MFKNNKKEKFSLRKYKDGRTDSKLIGATLLVGIGLLASGGTALADVSSNGTDTVTVVSDTSKVASTSATTFTDDTSSKTVKVDAVLGKDVAEPTKANHNTGDVDGNDTLNFKSEATVNYKLDSDKSLLKTDTVEVGTGTVTTPYDKKGLAYDTDGKDYRESTVNKPDAAVTEATGKKDTVEANNKVYEYVRSEVENADKLTYDKTKFNDIEARVSPEGMHNKQGEIDYTKTTGKVYLVEEIADGEYGKFVEANGVISDEDAVTKWKAGQADAKDFRKENVTLQEGDTVLVMDKDTYAVGDNKKVTTTKKYHSPSFEVENLTYVPTKFEASTYLLNEKENVSSEFYRAGADGVFGTADDEKVGEIDRLYKLNDSEGDNIEYGQDYFKGKKKGDSELKNARPADILKNDYHFYYELLKYAEEKARDFGDEAGLAKVIAAKERLDNFIEEKSKNIDIGYIKKGDNSVEYGYNLGNSFFDNDPERKSYKKDIENIIGDFTIKKENTTKEVDGIIEKTRISTRVFTFLTSDSSDNGSAEYFNNEEIKFQYVAIVTKENMTGELIETLVRNQEFNELTKKGTVTVEEDGTVTVVSPEESVEFKVYKGDTDEEIKGTNERYTITDNDKISFFSTKDITTHNETTYTTKEVITPIRAYKVMSEAKPVVTHYYREKITKEEAGEARASKQGSVVIKYVTTDGKQLKSETDKKNVTLETKTIVSLYSGETKVGERTEKRTVTENYDTTDKQYPTLVDAETGYTYEYVGLKQGSPEASGKVVEGTTEVVYEYRLVSEEEKTPSKSEVTKTGSVDVKHVVINEDGTLKTLKETEVVKNNVPLEYEDTYVTYSKGVKVSERTEKRTVTENYDTTDKQYPTLVDEATGLVYKYVGLTSDSAPATGDVTEGEKHVIYSYVLDKKEDATPTVTETKGSVVVKYVDADGNEIKDPENVVADAVVKTTKTYATKSGDVVLSTRDEVTENDVNYNAVEKKVNTINKDGKKYVFRGVYEVSDKYNNVLEETGKVKEGITTVVYQYDYVMPVDPTKPNEGENTPPKPEDKIPNDPQNRSYKDLGLITEVKRNITYVYENGPKAGQEASTPVNQTTRFTRTAEINSRTGEVVYTSEWTKEQKLVEVVSPIISKYVVDRAKVDELSVTHESTDSEEVVKYRENPDVIEHDAAKDKKGTVIVKFVDINENTLAADVIEKDNVVVEKASTIITGDKAETTYTATGEEYAVTAPQTIEVDGVSFKLRRVLPVSDKFNNTVEEKGLVKEGVTTIVYQYVMQIGAPSVEKPEHEGGVVPLDPPTVDKPEYEGGVVPLDPPIVDKPELDIPEEPTPAPHPEPKIPGKENVPGQPGTSIQVKRLANTGSETNNMAAVGFATLVAGIALAMRKRQREE